MTAYDIMCDRNKLQKIIEFLELTLNNSTGTVLLENPDIEDIIGCLKEARILLELRLSKIKVD